MEKTGRSQETNIEKVLRQRYLKYMASKEEARILDGHCSNSGQSASSSLGNHPTRQIK